eukprot:GILJ01031428.1.p1 GENE.GILJ01031428.1~~GILJ01031428.1.p1  ORF type:complete len:128 (-),score=13.11 GILJ01031428.1:184-567(-)
MGVCYTSRISARPLISKYLNLCCSRFLLLNVNFSKVVNITIAIQQADMSSRMLDVTVHTILRACERRMKRCPPSILKMTIQLLEVEKITSISFLLGFTILYPRERCSGRGRVDKMTATKMPHPSGRK